MRANTAPLSDQPTAELDGIVVSSGNLQLNRGGREARQQPRSAQFKSHSFGNWSGFKNRSFDDWATFKAKNFGNWTESDDNSSLSDRLDEMMESIERDLQELMNDTMSFTDFLKNGETFADIDDSSFSFSSSESFSNDSESDSDSAEQVSP